MLAKKLWHYFNSCN